MKRMNTMKALQKVKSGITPLVLALALAFAAGCSTTPKVKTEFDKTSDFSKYKTFAVLPVSRSGPASDPGVALRVGKPAEEEATATLVAGGFQPAEQGQADFSVLLRGESIPKVEVSQWGYTPMVGGRYGGTYGGMYVGGYGSSHIDVDQYDERSLIVEVYDNQTKKVVWVGWSKRRASGEITVEKARAAVRNVLSAFPPGREPAKP
jgi:hypothetical protein